MEAASNKINWFVRILIILFCICLFIMVFYNFLMVDPKGGINSGLITLLAICLILVLAESFDNFSIGKLISISKEAEKKEKQVQNLERRNTELINQIISIQNINSQTQQHTNVYGDYFTSKKSEKVAGQKIDSDGDVQKAVERLLSIVGESIVIKDIEGMIIKDLKENNLESKGPSINVLVRHLAGTKLLLTFEQIYNLIFGSQIYLLKKLNESAGIGKPITFVQQHIDHVKDMFKELSDWDCDSYLQFLYDRFLIIKKDDEMLHITNLGVEYLTWMIRNSRSENRPL